MQRGRKSANVVALRVDCSPPPLQPPAYLNAAERALFEELIAAIDTRHFAQSDLPLLTSFVQSSLLSRRTARDPKQVVVWEKATRLQAMLATRLRISPQSRYDARAAARQLEYQGPKPWEIRPGKEDDDGDDSSKVS
jgi:hypothetical protein